MTPLYIVIGVVVLALIVLTILYFIQQRKKKRQALAEESGESAGPGDDEISTLVREAENKLAAAKLEQGARLGMLPVYLLLGDRGCAKTSVMLHSGLDPELLAGQVYQQGNVTSTRTANFWYSRHSIFLEAAGGLLTDAPKWKKLVQKIKPRPSVVGKSAQAPRAAIVCFDCENFTKPGALESAAAAARGFRARLGEISQTLGINLPVYVLFTKMDRLPFFTEYVRNFSNDEASQVLGITLPMLGLRPEGVYAQQEAARLEGSFESLFRSLADARIEFLPRENDSSKLPAEYEFPREFRKTRQTVVQFLIDLCRPSQLTTGPFLRGFYFTGVRPVVINEAAPVQPALQQRTDYGSAAGATGIFRVGSTPPAAAPQQVVAGSRKVPQWMFLSQFFTGVVLADRGAMGASGSSTKTSGSRRILFAAAAALCFILVVLFTVSFFNNHALEGQVSDAAKGIASSEAAGADLASLDSLRKLETLRQSVDTLTYYHRQGAPVMYRWGLYAGDNLYPEARRLYFARFKQLLLNPTQTAILGFLRTLPATPGPDYPTTYYALKSYLITTSNHDKSTREFLSPQLMKRWQNTRTADTERQSLARKQFDFYSDELKVDDSVFSKANEAPVIDYARRYLSQFGGEDSVYEAMLTEARKNPAIDFNRLYPGSAPTIVEQQIVSGAFSKLGWAFMKDALQHPERYFKGEQWVLGEQAPVNIDPAKLQALRARYNSDFVKEWRQYMKSASIGHYANLTDASQKLSQLAGLRSPLLELFSLASTNTDVDDPSVKGMFQPVQAVVPPTSSDKFIGPSNQDYMKGLSTLQSAVDDAAKQTGQLSDAAVASVQAAASQAKATTTQMAQQAFNVDKDGHMETIAQTLLLEPIIDIDRIIRDPGAAINAAGKALCGEMTPLLKKYPFDPNSTTQATLAEVNVIFKPKDGKFAVFETSLDKVLQRNGSEFVPVGGKGVTFSSTYLATLNHAAAFSDAYANGAADPHVTYTVKANLAPDQESITLKIDGQSVEFTSANQSKTFNWPGGSQGVDMSVKYKDGKEYTFASYPGLWDIFEFVLDANSHNGSAVEMKIKSGKSSEVRHGADPVLVKLDITANPPVFGIVGMKCLPMVGK